MTVTASTPSYRFRRGISEYTTIPSPASTMINPGDLIFNNGGVAQVASAFTFTTDLPTTQALAKQKFLGVAMDYKSASDPSTTPILVCLKGVFEYPVTAFSAAHHIGEFVGPAKDTGSNMLDQKLAIAPTFDLGIGVLVEEALNGATGVVVYLQSSIYTSLRPVT